MNRGSREKAQVRPSLPNSVPPCSDVHCVAVYRTGMGTKDAPHPDHGVYVIPVQESQSVANQTRKGQTAAESTKRFCLTIDCIRTCACRAALHIKETRELASPGRIINTTLVLNRTDLLGVYALWGVEVTCCPPSHLLLTRPRPFFFYVER